MIHILVMITLLGFCSNLRATELRPFVEVGPQFQLMLTYGPWSEFMNPSDYDDALSSMDVSLKLGAEVRKWDFYVTYEDVSTLPEESWSWQFNELTLRSYEDAWSTHWGRKSIGLGARYRGKLSAFRPLVGVNAVVNQILRFQTQSSTVKYHTAEVDSFGNTYYREYYRTPTSLYEDNWKSAWNIGGGMDFGVGWTIVPALEVLTIASCNYSFANFGEDWLGNNIYDRDVISLAYRLQLRFSPVSINL